MLKILDALAALATVGTFVIAFFDGSVRPGLTYMCPHGAISLTP